MMPAVSEEDWAVIARRMARVPEAFRGYRETLEEGARRGLLVAPRQVRTVVVQLDEWLAAPYFTGFVAAGPEALLTELATAGRAADESVAEIRDFLRDVYAPQTEGTPDAVGRERYAVAVRRWTGSDLGAGRGLEEAYAWGWAEHRRILAEQRIAADKVLPGATPMEAMRWLGLNGPAVEGVEAIRERLQAMMDGAIEALDGTHFDLAEPVRKVEAMIAPPGSAAAPYYTRPAQDFSRPGRTWLPTLGRTRFPLWDLVSIWYHEGVPGHHLQLAQWAYVSAQLSTYQTSLGSVGANVEGWALYAERLMDELGYFTDPAERLGYLDAQQLRSVRVVIDIGMHLELPIPDDAEGVLADHRGAAVDARPRAGVPRRELRRRHRLPRQRAGPLPRHPRAGDQLQAGGAGVAGGPGGGAAGARRRLRPQGVAHGGAVAGLTGPRRPRRGARAAVAGGGERQAGDGRAPGHAERRPRAGANPAQVPGNAKDTRPR